MTTKKASIGKAIGIDLGTTFSAVAIMEGGKATIIPNSEGDRTTPSVVLIKGEERVVGKHAKNQCISNPKNTVTSIKRHMGDKGYHVDIDGTKHTPPEVSAMILQKMKRDAEAYLGHEVKDAVVTCPAYFNDAQRQATKDAGKIAGLNVLRIVNEPTAAALAYGIDKKKDEKVLVFDFGGGTFDVSVLELAEGVFEVKATSGDNFLGGDDIDQILVDWMAAEFKKETGIDLREDLTAAQRLKDAAEKGKIELSSAMTTTINLPFISVLNGQPKHFTKELSRAKFEQLIEPILARLKAPTLQAIKDSGLAMKDLDEIIFVGGSTRIPIVSRLVKDLTGKEGNKSVNPDEAVALGAAIQAGILGGEIKDVLLLDVTPLSLGIETLGGVLTKLIERNTTIPTRKSKVFSTAADNQPSVTINVLQGERAMAADNKSMGRFDLEGIPPAPRGVPQIEVTFDLDANGIVSVSAKDLGTGKEQKITVTGSSNLSEKEIEKMRKSAEENAEEDKRKLEEVETINEADAFVFASEKALGDLKGKVDDAKLKRVEEGKEELKSLLAAKNVHALKNKLAEVNKLMQELSTELYQKAGAAQKGHEGHEHKGGEDETVVDAKAKKK